MPRSLTTTFRSRRSLLDAPLSGAAQAAAGGRLVALVVLVFLTALGAANGGYFPGAWGWAALVLAWLAGLALVLDDGAAIGRPGIALVGLFAALSGWTLLSAVWSSNVTQTVLETQRSLVYLAGVLAALLIGRRSPGALLAGTWGAIVLLAGYGLLARLFPDRLGGIDPISGYRLSSPIGYWNSLGLLAGMGALLALGLAARSRSRALRAVASASVVPLVATLYFTFSRGGWIASAAGLAVLFVFDRRRLQLLTVAVAIAPWVALGVWLASRKPALTHQFSDFAAMTQQGHALAPLLVLAAAGAALAGLAVALLESRLTPPRIARASVGAATALALVAAVVVVSVRYGSPVSIARHAWGSFAARPPATGANLNDRLFNFSGSGRVTQWRVAWRQVEAHPVLGDGAGTYEQFWNQHQPVAGKIRNVHNLYLEALSTLGPLGLALLVAALAIPLACFRRARAEPLAAAALAAYVAFLLHAVADWDWQITSVALAALVCGVAIVLAGGSRRREPPLARRGRVVTLAAVAVLAAAAVYGIAGRIALARVSDAARQGRLAAVATEAGRASALMPWSSEPWQRAGEAQLQAGKLAAARASLQKAIAADSRNWQLWLDLAEASDGRQRAGALDRAEQLSPRSPEVAAYRQTLISVSRAQGAK